MYLETQNIQVRGVDVFLSQREIPQLGPKVAGLELKSISNRGTKIWPGQEVRCALTDVFQCRFLADEGQTLSQNTVLALLQELHARGLDFVHVEKLLVINGKPGYSEVT